jgi:hypothetical protein
MRDLAILFIRLFATIAKLMHPGRSLGRRIIAREKNW